MNARELSLTIITDIHTNGAYANVALTRELSKRAVSEQDRRFATELVYGTIKVGQTLDWILERYMSRKIEKVAPIVRDILRMGVYQLFFMDKVPASAACNQAVELAKKHSHRGAAQFVNAVLRNAARAPEKAAYPAPETDAAMHLSLRYFHPLWLVRRWLARFGAEDTQKICAFNNETPPLCLRTNTLKIDRAKLLDTLSGENVVAARSEWTEEGIVCSSHPSLTTLQSLKDGLFQVQDESSMLVAHVVDPLPGEFVIDACSAPGGKATHLAALMQNRGRVLAADIYEHKLERIEENAERLGIAIIETKLLDAALLGTQYANKADRVLVDAPCSGLGVLRRRPDLRWRKDDEIGQLPALQRRILDGAAEAVKLGGTLVYSTCTVEIEENQAIVQDFLTRHPEFSLEPIECAPTGHRDNAGMIQLLPHIDGSDGFFIAKMKRAGR